jgi:hypothetical protein
MSQHRLFSGLLTHTIWTTNNLIIMVPSDMLFPALIIAVTPLPDKRLHNQELRS